MQILIIEDDQRVAELINRGLTEEGFETTVAFDGLSGLKLMLHNDYDLIITDIILPKMDGLDLSREIRSIKPQFERRSDLRQGLWQNEICELQQKNVWGP